MKKPYRIVKEVICDIIDQRCEDREACDYKDSIKPDCANCPDYQDFIRKNKEVD